MSKVGDGADTPRALIHKRILSVAAEQPDASLAAIAETVGAATPDLVDRVLEEYGDPGGTDGTQAMNENGHSPDEKGSKAEPTPADTSSSAMPDTAELTTEQLDAARAVYENPDASQAQIADQLGVTQATVSRQLNDIPEFEWANREAFTAALFGERPPETSEEPEPAAESESSREQTEALADLEKRVSKLEAAITDDEKQPDNGQAAGSEIEIPVELAHKVVHASLTSDRITEDEELELLAALVS
jgi:transcriptional regulator with XRE-family HTH domain